MPGYDFSPFSYVDPDAPAGAAVPALLLGGSAFGSWTPTPEPLTAAAAREAAVTMDTVAQIQSHLLAHQYEGLIKRARLKGARRR